MSIQNCARCGNLFVDQAQKYFPLRRRTAAWPRRLRL